MSNTQYLILAYALGLGLLWGYGLILWRALRSGASSEGDES